MSETEDWRALLDQAIANGLWLSPGDLRRIRAALEPGTPGSSPASPAETREGRVSDAVFGAAVDAYNTAYDVGLVAGDRDAFDVALRAAITAALDAVSLPGEQPGGETP